MRSGAPQKRSWLAAFGLTLSLVRIYLEMLRFLSRFYSRDQAPARGSAVDAHGNAPAVETAGAFSAVSRGRRGRRV